MQPNDTQPQLMRVAIVEPAGLGLFGLAIVTLVASSQKLVWTTGTSLIVPWAIFLGSIAQLFACVSDSRRGNIFGTTAFGAFGLFWLGVAMSWMTTLGVFGAAAAKAADPKQLGMVFIGYLIFTLYMTVAAMETNKVLFIIFVLIDFLFLGLSLTTFEVATEFTHTMAGWAEFLCAMVSFYGSAATVLNHHFGRPTLPMGKPFGIFSKPVAGGGASGPGGSGSGGSGPRKSGRR
jgi:uncharacterized protein